MGSWGVGYGFDRIDLLRAISIRLMEDSALCSRDD